jgi:hypothetical protein
MAELYLHSLICLKFLWLIKHRHFTLPVLHPVTTSDSGFADEHRHFTLPILHPVTTSDSGFADEEPEERRENHVRYM